MRYLIHYTPLMLLASLSQMALAEEVVEKKIKILGKTVEVKQMASHDASQVETLSQIKFLGKKIEIAKSSVKYRVNENDGTSFDSSFYVNGKKVLAQGLVSENGSYEYSADIPAGEISGDLITYSIGILTVGIHSGVSYEGLLKSKVSSELLKTKPQFTPDMNLIDASAKLEIVAKGFIEGQVKAFFIKGGVGGSLNLIEGNASVAVSMNSATITLPEATYEGTVHLLSGDLYAYVGSGSKKWLSHSFYKSNGQCYSLGASECPN